MVNGIGNNGNNVGASPIKQTKVDEHSGQQSQQSKISIFSSYDANKDTAVNYKEANKFNLFGQAKVNHNDSILRNFGDSNFQNRVKSIAVEAFSSKMGNMFKSALQNFSVTVSDSIITDKGEKDPSIKSKQQGLDTTVKTEAGTAARSANEILQKAYQEALIEAVKEANLDKEAGTGDEAITDTDMGNMLTKGKVDAKDVSGKNNIEITKTAYSTYDTSQDTTVDKAEAKISDLNTGNYVTGEMNGALKSAIEQDLSKLYDIKTNAFSVNSGSEEITGKDQKEVDKKVEKFAKKADKLVEKETKAFIRGLDNELKAQVNKTIDSMGEEGGLNGRQRPISGDYNGKSFTILNGQCMFDGKPAQFTPNKQGGGTVTSETVKSETVEGQDITQNVKYQVMFNVDSNGSVSDYNEVKLEVIQDLKQDGAVHESQIKDNSTSLPEDYKPTSTKAEGYSSKGETPEAVIINHLLDGMFDFLNDKNSSTNDVTETDTQKNTFDKGKFEKYKKAGVSVELARYMADSANGVTPASYDNKGKITKVYVKNNSGQRVQIDIKDLEAYIKKQKETSKSS